MNSNVSSWKIPFNNLKPVIADQRYGILSAMERVLDSGIFINGPEVEAFEKELAEYCGVKYAVSCANGTDALILAALAYRHKTDNKKIMTVGNSAPATVAAIRRAGYEAVYVDINERGLMEPWKHRDVWTKVGGTVLVNLYGQQVEYDTSEHHEGNYNEFVIEDGAQSLGTKTFCKSKAHVWTTSFYPTKNLGALGDGGAVLTNISWVADEVRLLKNYGLNSNGQIVASCGFNSRLDELQAAILRWRIRYLDKYCDQRRIIARLYDLTLDPTVKHRPFNLDENYHLYTILCNDRENLRKYLADRGIQTAVHYNLSVNHNLDNTYVFQNRVLSLPCWPGMKQEDAVYVAACVNDFICQK